MLTFECEKIADFVTSASNSIILAAEGGTFKSSVADDLIKWQTSTVPPTPLLPLEPSVPELPLEPSIPDVPELPLEPSIPDVPDVPLEPSVPLVSLEPSVPSVPSVPLVPLEPSVPSAPDVPELPLEYMHRACSSRHLNPPFPV